MQKERQIENEREERERAEYIICISGKLTFENVWWGKFSVAGPEPSQNWEPEL